MPAMQPRDRFIENLREYAPEITAEKLQELKDYCVILEYFKRPNHCGGIMHPEESPERRQLSNGQWVEWKHVKIELLIESAESTVKNEVPENRRTEVWYRVFKNGLESHRRLPKWEQLQPKHMTFGTAKEWREYFASLGNPESIDTTQTVEPRHLPGYELFQNPELTTALSSPELQDSTPVTSLPSLS